jgi:hypothetical protein
MANESYSEEGINGSLINLQGYISPDNNDFKLTNKGISSWSFDGSIPLEMRYVEIWNRDLAEFNVKPGQYILITDDPSNPQARPIVRISTEENKRFFNKTENSSVDFSEYLPSIEITNVFGDGEFITYTADNDLIAGDRVTIANVLPSIYNFVNVPVISSSATSFTVSGTGTTSYVSGGTAEIIASFTSEIYVDYLDENFIEQRKAFLPLVGQEGYPLETIYLVYEKWEERNLGRNGWTISSSGNAIFNNLAVRGEINATSGNFDGFVTVNNGLMKIGTDVSSLEEANVTQFEIDTEKVILTTESNHNFIVDDIIVVEGIDSINAMFPDFPESNLIVTGAVGDGEEVTYTCVNSLIPGSEINITGVTPASYNASQVSVFSATPTEIVIKSTVTDTYVSGGEIEVTGIPSNPQDINGRYVVSAVTSNTISYDFVGNDFGPAPVSGTVKGELTNSGLYIDSTNYWYDDGSFSLGTDTKSISFDGTNVTISSDVIIEGGLEAESIALDDYNYWTPTLTGAEFRVGSATAGISWDESTFEIKGDLVTGTIGASAGGINGWNISEGIFASGETTTYVALSASPSNAYSIWAGGETASTAPFSVKRDGTLNATNATIEGEITATSGNIGNWTINSQEIFSDISDVDNTYRTGIKAATGLGGGTYTPSIFYMVHDHDTESATPSFNSANTPFYADSNGRFSLADKLYFDQDIHGSGDNAQLVVIGKIRGQIENTELALDAIPNANAKTITQIEITATDTAVITAATHGFAVDDTVIISDLTTTVLNGAWKVFSVTTNTFTIKSTSLTVGSPYSDSGLARIRELTLGLHPAVGSAPAGLGIRLDEYNYWFVNNKFRIGGSVNYVDWSGSQLEVKGTINDLELGRGGGNIASNFAVGINALDSNTTGANNIALGEDTLKNNTTGSFNVAVGYRSLLQNTIGTNNVGIGTNTLVSNTTGIQNIAIGDQALKNNVTGKNNIAIGNSALLDNSTTGYYGGAGDDNIAIGNEALYANSGPDNIGVGYQALYVNNGYSNIAVGYQSMVSNLTGSNNVAIGFRSLKNNISGGNNIAIGGGALDSNTAGDSNVAIGQGALSSNLIGVLNLAIGSGALSANTSNFNLAIGSSALQENTDGYVNLAIGLSALRSNTTASYNLAIGSYALASNTTGQFNLAIGGEALTSNTIGGTNLAIGYQSLDHNTEGFANLAIGAVSMRLNTTGNYNVAIGPSALHRNETGSHNTAIGYYSLFENKGDNNIAIGYNALASNNTAAYNIAIGYEALTDNVNGGSNLAIGHIALTSNYSGTANIAIGRESLRTNVSGSYNTAIGYGSLDQTKGDFNLGIGYYALAGSSAASKNLAIGHESLKTNGAGQENLAIGYRSLYSNTTGVSNLAIGSESLYSNVGGINNVAIGPGTLFLNVTSSNNVAIGREALYNNIADSNLAIGSGALKQNTQGSSNVAIGRNALLSNTTGFNNTAIGSSALLNNTTGIFNTAIGLNTLRNNVVGINNTAIGIDALRSNLESNNLAIGTYALTTNSTGTNNLAIGVSALRFNTTGSLNLAIGSLALYSNTTGLSNVAIGSNAMRDANGGRFNVAVGEGALFTSLSDNNVAIGYQALSQNSIFGENTAIGYRALRFSLGQGNIAIGNNAMVDHKEGNENIAIGASALSNNITGYSNLAIGVLALDANLYGSGNVSIGHNSLQLATAGNNVAIGNSAGSAITTGANNLFIGGFTGTGFTTSSNHIHISDGSGNVRIRSDSGGRVTMPAQPAFSVYSSFVSTQSGNLTYNSTNSNNGGHMNLGTGLFTAPVAGHYHFNYYGFIDTGLSGNSTITFQKNGAGFPSRAYNDFNDASYGPVITISAVIYLAANDNVRVNISGAGVHGNDSSFFSGFLIG